MSEAFPTRPRSVMARRSFAIVASQYNPTYVHGLVENAKNELASILPNANLAIHEVPGAFEIPIMVQEVAAAGGVDAIIAFGVIIQGQTQHAELIARAITDALQRIALQFRVPVIHEVLFVRDEDQARQRCLEPE